MTTTTAELSTLLAPDEEVPFQAEMFREYEAGNVHQFILYFNVHDYVFTPTLADDQGYVPLRLRDYLGHLLHARGFDVVIYYSLSKGLSYLDEEVMAPLLQDYVPDTVRHRGRYYGQSRDGREDVVPMNSESVVALSYLDRILTYRPSPDEAQDRSLRIAVVLEYLEALAPHEDSNQPRPYADFVVQMLHQWAMDRRMRRRHMIVGLASDLGHVASTLYAGTSESRAYRVDLPIEEPQSSRSGVPPRRERTAWLTWVLEGLESHLTNPLTQPGGIEAVQTLATQTSGFNYDNLRDIVYYAAQAGDALTVELVQQRKRAIITAESRDLLEVVEPSYGFEMVAGYEYIKEYLGSISEAVHRQGSDAALAAMVPKGILFLGPPGTGKSFVAAALARETGFNMVKFKNIRSMWVGESERNLDRVLDLLSGMAPVIVFVDEIDQALGQRQMSGAGGGSGVERRLFQRLLEFMAMDENRGRVLWIAASNRPDGIDQALLSRFDIVIPFLLPDTAARREMLLEAYPPKIGYDFDPVSEDHLRDCVQRTDGFSGRELDTICRRALQIAGEERLASGAQAPSGERPIVTAEHVLQALEDFRQARDLTQYELQTLLAIQHTNFYSFLPSAEEMPPSIRPADSSDTGDDTPLDEEALRERIETLRVQIGHRRLSELGLSS